MSVFLVNQAPPASADHGNDETVWSAKLTVKDLGSSNFGCDSGLSAQASKCSTPATLSEDDFTYNSTNYRVGGLNYNGTENELKLVMDSGNPNVVFRGLALVVD